MTFNLFGGVGLFLIGMFMMTDGLKLIAGDALREILRRFTRTTLSGVLSGTVVTLAVQSSSVTTLTTIGFVSAGLLNFTQAVGIIYGANIGTTGTSWLVSLIGLKVKLELLAMPLVGIGAMLKLFGHGKWKYIGMTLAGFGMLFIGIDLMKNSMQGLSGRIDISQFSGDTWFNMLVLLMLGIVMTVILQSSSAAMATTLTALYAGAISLEQGMALCIGQSIGTTVTAAIGALNGSISAKQAALAHILFNVITGVVAFSLLPAFGWIVHALDKNLDPGDATIALSAFQTTFKTFGVIMFLPLTRQFTQVIEKILPDRRMALTRRLDNASLITPAIGIEAVWTTTQEIAKEMALVLRELLFGEIMPQKANERIDELVVALDETRKYLAKIFSDPGQGVLFERHIALLHLIDHLYLLHQTAKESKNSRTFREVEEVRKLGDSFVRKLGDIADWMNNSKRTSPLAAIAAVSADIAARRRSMRPQIIEAATQGKKPGSADKALDLLDAIRWVDRLAYHTWRIVEHFSKGFSEGEAPRSSELEFPDAVAGSAGH